MTPEAQRIVIAEACGWDRITPSHWIKQGYDAYGVGDLPNYLNDLNAMHEAEKFLTWEQKRRYVDKLQRFFGVGYFTEAHCATATQRAEAFLRTLNLYE